MTVVSSKEHTPEQYPNWQHLATGKVRDLYTPADGSDDRMLLVASNRISAFDFLLEPEIPGKGALLTGLSRWWFAQLEIANHLLPNDVDLLPAAARDRGMVVKKLRMLPVECVVRGAITGSGFLEYQETGSVCGIKLAPNLADGDLLADPIYTPAYKAPQGAHDENITFEQTIELVGEDLANRLRDESLKIFKFARDRAASAGLILADTKFEFGIDDATGTLVLADEVLTSDSSRYWDAAAYEAGIGKARMQSFDKQIVRNWLLSNWDREAEPTPPTLPDEIVTRTLEKYRELYTKLTGETAPA